MTRGQSRPRTCRSHAGLRGSRAWSGVSRLPITASHDSTAARVRSDMKLVHESRIHMQSPTSPSRSVGAAPTVLAPRGAAAARPSALTAAECSAKCAATCKQHRRTSAPQIARVSAARQDRRRRQRVCERAARGAGRGCSCNGCWESAGRQAAHLRGARVGGGRPLHRVAHGQPGGLARRQRRRVEAFHADARVRGQRRCELRPRNLEARERGAHARRGGRASAAPLRGLASAGGGRRGHRKRCSALHSRRTRSRLLSARLQHRACARS